MTWQDEMNHEPTRKYHEALSMLLSRFGAENILEIGVATGISTRAFLENKGVRHLTSLDPNECNEAVQHIAEIKRTGDWTFHHMTSQEYLADCKRTFDLVYVDGDHHYQSCKHDLDKGWEVLEHGGWILCHDVFHRHNFDGEYGIAKAVAQFVVEKEQEAHIHPSYPCIIYLQKP